MLQLLRKSGLIEVKQISISFWGLKLRTLLVAIFTVAIGYLSINLMLSAVPDSLSAFHASTQRQIPPAHVPLTTQSSYSQQVATLAFGIIFTLSLLGFSLGNFGKSSLKFVLILPVSLFLLLAIFAPEFSVFGKLWPNKIEREINAGRYQSALSSLSTIPVSETTLSYIKAQIALRNHDNQGMRENGQRVLDLAEQWAYGILPAPDSRNETHLTNQVIQFDPQIVLAIDLALNQQASTAVGLRQIQVQPGYRLPVWLKSLMQIVIGVCLLLLSIKSLSLWNTMRLRIRAIHLKLQEESQLEFAAVTEIPPSDVEGNNVAQQTIRSLSIGSSLVLWRLSRRQRFLLSCGLAVILAVVFNYKVMSYKADLEELSLPCYFIGDWTAARTNSVYKISLAASGQFQASPIAQGNNSMQIITGKWSVRGHKMEWQYQASGRNQFKESNPIRNQSPDNFQLIEENNEITVFNRIKNELSIKCNN